MITEQHLLIVDLYPANPSEHLTPETLGSGIIRPLSPMVARGEG